MVAMRKLALQLTSNDRVQSEVLVVCGGFNLAIVCAVFAHVGSERNLFGRELILAVGWVPKSKGVDQGVRGLFPTPSGKLQCWC